MFLDHSKPRDNSDPGLPVGSRLNMSGKVRNGLRVSELLGVMAITELAAS